VTTTPSPTSAESDAARAMGRQLRRRFVLVMVLFLVAWVLLAVGAWIRGARAERRRQ
jgi:hypothetical protein